MSKAVIRAFKRSGLKQHELASILNVSRMTVNSWLCERHAIHPLMKRRATLVAVAISKAIEDKELPYEGNLKGFDRLKKVRRIVATGLTKIPAQA